MNGRILMFVVSVLVLWFSSIVDACPSGWINHGSKCYHFSHDLENWADAMVMCRILGGNLAEIKTANENTFIEGYAHTAGQRYWVGASDVLNEREWKWMTSKTALSITHWHAGEPNNDYDGNENCMEINNDGGWNDAECRILLKYICEMENSASPAVG